MLLSLKPEMLVLDDMRKDKRCDFFPQYDAPLAADTAHETVRSYPA